MNDKRSSSLCYYGLIVQQSLTLDTFLSQFNPPTTPHVNATFTHFLASKVHMCPRCLPTKIQYAFLSSHSKLISSMRYNRCIRPDYAHIRSGNELFQNRQSDFRDSVLSGNCTECRDSVLSGNCTEWRDSVLSGNCAEWRDSVLSGNCTEWRDSVLSGNCTEWGTVC